MILRTTMLTLAMMPTLFQGAKPADAFKAFETKFADAKTLAVTVKLEVTVDEPANATAMLDSNNRLYLEVVPIGRGREDERLKVVSDGTRWKGLENEEFDQATPKTLTVAMSRAFVRMGVMGMAYLATENRRQVEIESAIPMTDLATGAAERAGNREATVLTYVVTVKADGEDLPLNTKLWIDPATGLPLKRSFTGAFDGEIITVTETYESIKLNEPVDAKKFEFPDPQR